MEQNKFRDVVDSYAMCHNPQFNPPAPPLNCSPSHFSDEEETSPARALDLVSEGIAHFNDGNLPEAENAFRAALALGPTHAARRGLGARQRASFIFARVVSFHLG